MMQIKNHLAPNPNAIGELVKIGMRGPEGRQLLQQYYSNPPEWMTPQEARLYVPIAAERLDRIREATEKLNPPETTVAEDKVAGLAGLQPQQGGAPQQAQPQQQAQPEEQAQPDEQGVASLPVPEDMYQEESMAAGGIVAFDGGGEVPSFATGGLNTLQMQSNLQYLLQQYNALPEGDPQKAELAMVIQQIENQMNPATTPPEVTPAASSVSPLSKYPGLQQADTEISGAKSGIAKLMKQMEMTPEELQTERDRYMTERTGAGADFRTKAEELMKKQEARVSDVGKNADLHAALSFFTSLAGSTSPFFGVAAGQAGTKALDYYDTALEKRNRAQAALEATQINYNLARAAEAKGDLDARDRFEDRIQDNRRKATQAQIAGLEAAGKLAAEQSKTILKLGELDIRRLGVDAQRTSAAARDFAARNPAQKIMWDTVRNSIIASNDKGEYGKKLTGPQIDALTAKTFSDMRGGGAGVSGDKLNTIRNAVAEEVSKNIRAKVPGQDPRYEEIRSLNKANKTKEAAALRSTIEQELFQSRTSGLGYTGPGALMGGGEGSLMGGGQNSLGSFIWNEESGSLEPAEQ